MQGKHAKREAELQDQLSALPSSLQAQVLEGWREAGQAHSGPGGPPSGTHLGGRLPEQRSVVQAAGPVGPGSKILHFGAAPLVP